MNTWIQTLIKTRVYKYKKTMIQKYQDTKIEEYQEKGHKNTRIPKILKDKDTRIYVYMYRNTKIQE